MYEVYHSCGLKKKCGARKKKYYKGYKGPFMKHLHRCGINGIGGVNRRCWKETKEKFLKKSNHNTRLKQKIFKEVGDIILNIKSNIRLRNTL